MRPVFFLSAATLLTTLLVGTTAPDTLASPEGQKKSNRRFVTFTQSDWGSAVGEGGRAAKLRDARFNKAFPDGLTIGSRKEGGVEYTLQNAKALARLLPLEGKSRTMKIGNPEGARQAGPIVGQLVTAKLNVAFNDQGLIPDQSDRQDSKKLLARMVFKSNVHRKLNGVSVRRLIRLADQAISGRLGSPNSENKPLIDVDRSGKPDLSLDDLRHALRVLNWNYRHDSIFENSLKPGPPKDSGDGPIAVGPKPLKPEKPGVVIAPKKVDPPRTIPEKIKTKPPAKPVDSDQREPIAKKTTPLKGPSDQAQLLERRNEELKKLRTFYLAALKQAKTQASDKGLDKIPAETLKRMEAEYKTSTEKINAKYKALTGAQKPKPGSKAKSAVRGKPKVVGTPKKGNKDG